jgi:hypothetical protein
MELWVEFPARVVPVCGHNPVCRCPVLVRTIQPNTRGSVVFCLSECLSNSFVVGGNQALIPADERLNRNRLRRGECQIVQRSPFALFASICINAVSTVARPEEFPRLWMQPFSNCFKLLPRYLPMQAKQLRTASMPLPLNATAFIVIVAVFQMALGISGTIRHGSQSQHNQTLTLFEIRMQWPMSRYPAEEHHDA